MKKQFLILSAIFGLSFKSYASTGSSDDEVYLYLGAVGILLIILGIVSLFDYLKKNGKMLIKKSFSFLKKKTISLSRYFKKVFSEKFDFSYFKFQ